MSRRALIVVVCGVVIVMVAGGRAVLMSLVLILPVNEASALLCGGVMGLLWLATVPLTSGIVAQVFDTRYFSMLFGVVFMSHQFGSFGGAWLGGYIYNATGSYDLMWVWVVSGRGKGAF